jgi:hypothetical protein
MAPVGQDPIKVLDLLRVLHDLGAADHVEPGSLVDALDAHGLRGFTFEEEPFFLMMGRVMGRLLRHATDGVDAAFDVTRAELVNQAR